jgi:hypothetical protein
MKSWSMAALFAGILAVPLVIQHLRNCLPKNRHQSDRRYSIDDLIVDQPIN